MTACRTVGLIDNLQHIDKLVLQEGYAAPLPRYMAAVGGNTGNLAFVEGSRTCIGDKLTRIGWGWKTEQVHSQADVIVITCANQIGKHVDLGGWADAIVRMDLPVVLVGLGAQTPNYESAVEIPEGSIRFLREVQKRRFGGHTNISVRGEFTRQVLEGIGVESEITGCPSLYISPERRLGRAIAARCMTTPISKVAIAAGNPFHPMNRRIEGRMAQLCSEHQGAYIVQHPDSLVGLALDAPIDEKKLKTVSDALGFGEMEDCRTWFRRYAYSFHQCDVWMHFLRHFDAVVGARYHGVALGIQAGIPGLTLHIDNRTRELSETTCIPSIGIADVDQLSLEELLGKLAWNAEAGAAFDANRVARAGSMIEFLEGNGITPSSHLQRLST